MSDIRDLNAKPRTARIFEERSMDNSGFISFTDARGEEFTLHPPRAPTTDDMERTRQLMLGMRALRVLVSRFNGSMNEGDFKLTYQQIVQDLCQGSDDGEED